jgi:hypothetical protein
MASVCIALVHDYVEAVLQVAEINVDDLACANHRSGLGRWMRRSLIATEAGLGVQGVAH